jgi:hypothetical protein
MSGDSGRLRSAWASRQPSVVGSFSSLMTTSGRARPARMSASQPSEARSTMWPDCDSTADTIRCVHGSSSTTSTRAILEGPRS